VADKLLSLEEAADYIMKLSKAEQNLPEWQAATRGTFDGG
jgi:hypothetical protein